MKLVDSVAALARSRSASFTWERQRGGRIAFQVKGEPRRMHDLINQAEFVEGHRLVSRKTTPAGDGKVQVDLVFASMNVRGS